MPRVGGKKFPYTPAGRAAAKKAAKRGAKGTPYGNDERPFPAKKGKK